MKTIKRNSEARLFKREKATDFGLPVSQNQSSASQRVESSTLIDRDYNKFFLDLLNDNNLKRIAEKQNTEEFIQYISSEFQNKFPNYKMEFEDIAIQRVCTSDWCLATYAVVAVVAAALVNIVAAAVDTVPLFRNIDEENVFLNGILTLSNVLGDENFEEDVRIRMNYEISKLDIASALN